MIIIARAFGQSPLVRSARRVTAAGERFARGKELGVTWTGVEVAPYYARLIQPPLQKILRSRHKYRTDEQDLSEMMITAR